MDEINQDTDICYVTSQMARRIFWQLRIMKEPVKGTREYEKTMEAGHRELPWKWFELAEDWSKDHHIGRVHGIMALLHLRGIFGIDWSELELRVILDCAFEEAKNIELVRE